MAHVHGSAAKSASTHAMHGSGGMGESMSHHAHAAHGAGAAMPHHGGAGAMMQGGHMMPNMPRHPGMMEQMHQGAQQMMTEMPRHAGMMAMGTAAAGTSSGRGFLGRLIRHPLFVFGLGMTVGYLAHKYRKEIIASASGLTNMASGHTEPANLEELVSECQDCHEADVTQ